MDKLGRKCCIASAAIILAIGLVTACQTQTEPGGTTPTPPVEEDPISVNYEWGTAREVIVGIGEGLKIPGFSDKVSFIYDPAYIDMMIEYGGRPAIEVEPEDTPIVQEQINHFADVLEEQGVTVHRPRLLDDQESEYLTDIQVGQMQLYARDPILVIGNKVFETSIKIPMRAKEKFPLRDIIRQRVEETPSAEYVSMPVPNPNFSEEGIYIEGGDVLLNGYEIYVGVSGNGSNQAGIDWLQRELGDKYTVHAIHLSSTFEHLDCIMSLMRPGLGLLCRDALEGELPDSLKDWDWIEVSVEEAKNLGANVMVLDHTTVIMDSQHERIIQEVKNHGQTVIEVPYDKMAKWGGAFRCSHHPLYREDVLTEN